MLRRWLFRAIIFTSLSMFHGCGTVRNLEGPVPAPGRHESSLEGVIGPPGGREIYGGVRFDLVGFQMLFDPISFPVGNLLGVYLIGVGLPLSFITDTLTLPWIIGATQSRVSTNNGTEPGQVRTASSAADPAKTP